MHVPKIQSEGPPPERHAARVVAEMAQWLRGDEQHWRAMIREQLAFADHELGNPKAQERWARRVRKSGCRWLLAFGVIPGKRGKFGLNMVFWSPAHPGGELLKPEDPVPEKPWLVAVAEQLYPKDEARNCAAYVVALTHHAMQRMAERAGARTPYDLTDALQKIALGLMDRPPLQTEIGKVIELPFPGGRAVIENTQSIGWVVKTVLPASGGELVPDAQVGADVTEGQH